MVSVIELSVIGGLSRFLKITILSNVEGFQVSAGFEGENSESGALPGFSGSSD